MNTFTSFCVGACIFMIFFGMSIGFIGLMGAFPTGLTTGFTPGNSTETVTGLTGNVTGVMGHFNFWDLWGATTGLALGGALAIGILTKSTNMIGTWVFGTFFWSSWGSMLTVFYTFDFLSSGAGLMLITMITVGMAFIFVAAVIGMLSGSIWMR